jgi:hypothetical protein
MEENDPTLAQEAFAVITALFHFPLTTLVRKHAWTFNSDPVRDFDSEWFFSNIGVSEPRRKPLAAGSFRGDLERLEASGKQVLAREAILEAIAKAKNPALPRSSVLSQINDWIGGSAYLDSGYQIKVDIKICLPIHTLTDPKDKTVSLDDFFEVRWADQDDRAKFSKLSQIVALRPDVEFLARIFLADQTGRELRFSEVGTGFSQILPILTYLGISSNYIVRQPEVHLHPKLQSRVADCFVNSIASDREDKFSGNLIVETHSEHFVLRLLRRIRNSYQDKLLHTSLTLYPEELSLIYLKPIGDRSEVYLIRVDKSGNFVDGWPDGFFDERDEDLWN